MLSFFKKKPEDNQAQIYKRPHYEEIRPKGSIRKIIDSLGVEDMEFTADPEGEQNLSMSGYENPQDQMIFYDTLEDLRHTVDEVEDDKRREEMAQEVYKIINVFASYSRELEESTDPEHMRRKRDKYLLDLKHSGERFFDVMEKSRQE